MHADCLPIVVVFNEKNRTRIVYTLVVNRSSDTDSDKMAGEDDVDMIGEAFPQDMSSLLDTVACVYISNPSHEICRAGIAISTARSRHGKDDPKFGEFILYQAPDNEYFTHTESILVRHQPAKIWIMQGGITEGNVWFNSKTSHSHSRSDTEGFLLALQESRRSLIVLRKLLVLTSFLRTKKSRVWMLPSQISALYSGRNL